MPDDDSSCSGNQNSTGCLLKALLGAIDQQSKAEDAEFNWDPLSFGFTAPVGILAALFTFLTVVQMLLASGPGRRRSDKQVIGRWSSKKKTRLSWTEMRLVTIVPTPVLRVIPLKWELIKLRGCPPPPPPPLAETNTTGKIIYRLAKLWVKLLPNVDIFGTKQVIGLVIKWKWSKKYARSLLIAYAAQSSRAKWLVHLDELGLEDFIFEKVDVEQNAADYLPSDLQAVPAYSEVGCAVALAAASGISSLKTDGQSPYPLIIGDSFQLHFREHPLLGSIGVFSRYGRRMKTQNTYSKNDILLALCHAEGEVVSRVEGLCVSARKLYAYNDPLRPYCRCEAAPNERICSLTALLYEKHKNLLWLISAQTPYQLPVIFPSRSVNLRNVLTTYILQAKSWAHMRGARGEDDIRTIFLSEYGQINVVWADEPIVESHTENQELCYFLAGQRLPSTDCQTIYPFCRQAICGIITDVFQLCLRFIYDTEEFEDWWLALSKKQAEMYRKAILLQIQQLDKILAAVDESLLECRRTTIYLTAQAFSIVEEDVATQTLDADRLTQSPMSKIAGTSLWESPRTRSFHNCVDTLRVLDALLTPHEGSNSNSNNPVNFDSEFARQESRLKMIVSPRYCPGPASPCPGLEALLGRLKSTVDGYKMVQEGPEGQQGSDNREPRWRTMEEAIDDVLIWRIVLLGLLFLTVPDNSVILDSGLWNHVIPLL